MTSFGKRGSLKHLGTIRGSGSLSIGQDAPSLGAVSYEIDSYLERTTHSANGQIEGDVAVLERAFKAGGALIALDGGQSVDVVLSDPQGGPSTEIIVSNGLPI